MKKLALILTLSAMTSLAAFGQGFINFNQASGQLIVTNGAVLSVFDPGGTAWGSSSGATAQGNTVVGTTYYFAVLTEAYSGSGPLQSNVNPITGGWTFGGIMESNKASGQPGTLGQLSNVQTTSNWPTGSTNQYIIVGWSANLGATWAAVSNELANQSWSANGLFGVSAVGDIMPNTQSPGFNLFGAVQPYGNPINSDTTLDAVSATPEPSTMALTGLGSLAMLLFRRRNRK